MESAISEIIEALMDRLFNPFNELYVGETVSTSDYVELFSPALLPSTGALFLPGNVVLKGAQGSGKSMLLNLLRPEVRIAYEKRGEKYPLAGRYAQFIGAGINLTTSNAIAFGQRRIRDWDDEEDPQTLYFADFVNYWIVLDMLVTIESLRDGLSRAGARTITLRADGFRLDSFAADLATSRCWFGYFRGVSTYRELRRRLEGRLNDYLSFLNFNSNDLPQEIRTTKTHVGDPIAATAEQLRRSGVISDGAKIFVQIDQMEELFRLEGLHSQYGTQYRSVIYKALGLRNPHVSYRIGTRGYAWAGHLRMFGTTGNLERDRNYKLIDLDEILRRQENRRTWIFPAFAEDVFRRRMLLSVPTGSRRDQEARFADKDALLSVFGRGQSPDDRARSYCRNSPHSAVRPDKAWPDTFVAFLYSLSERDPISARLAEAWARQRGKGGIVNHIPAPPFPWDEKEKSYWKKERIPIALMQIAARCAQRLTWGGKDDILELSGGNILVFVSLCQHIWNTWLRTEPEGGDFVGAKLPDNLQAIGILETSTLWYEKVSEEPGGTTRRRFVEQLALLFQKTLHEDLALSNPGYNGFSLSLEDYDDGQFVAVREFLRDCVAFGVLFDFPHTTKLKDRKQRRKWYLNPIYSPHFKIPHVHTKEPLYVTADDVREWIKAAEVMPNSAAVKAKLTVDFRNQGKLFSE